MPHITLPALRRGGALALAGVAAAALLTGCTSSGGPEGSSSPTGKPLAGPEKAGPGMAVLRGDTIRKALVTDTELRSYEAQEISPPNVRPKSDREECRPLADMTASGKARTPEAVDFASRSYVSTGTPGLTTTVSLFSYEGDDARRTFTDVRKALATCGAGFTTSGNSGGSTVKYVAVKEEEAPEGGDEAVSWRMTGTAQGSAMPMQITAVRQGRNVAVFFTLNLLDPKKADLPKDLHGRQTAKLAKAIESAGTS